MICGTYDSVTNQAGIYAGTDGYDITVKENATVTGSVIDSKATPDKNSLTTGTLTMKDIENKAVYEDSYRGIGYTYDRKYETIMGKAKDHQPISDEERTYVNDRYNRMGLVPDLGMPSSDSVTSTTKSAIAPGKLTVTKEPVNRNTVNRNTKNALNELGKIFDKKKLEERQELSKLFAKNANEAIHKMSESKGWEDGSKEKIALHTLVSGITAQLGGQPFADGAIAGGINEAVVGKLMDAIGRDNPDMVQIASAVLGYATNKLAGKDGQAGAAVAQWGTKWNNMYDNDITEGRFMTYNDALYAINIKLAWEMEKSRYDVEYGTQAEFESRYYWIVSKVGAAAASLTGEYQLAGELLNVSLQGGGDQRFKLGSLASNKLSAEPNLVELVHRLGENIPEGETAAFYSSIAASGGAWYAFGHIKLAINITHNYDGTYSVNGLAGDVYNYEEHSITKFGDFINNAAYELQLVGRLKPYIYYVEISTKV